MKMNFWQILGILFVIGGLIGIAYKYGYIGSSDPKPSTTLPAK